MNTRCKTFDYWLFSSLFHSDLRDSCNIKHSTTVLFHFIIALCSFSLSISVKPCLFYTLLYWQRYKILSKMSGSKPRDTTGGLIGFFVSFVASTLLSIFVNDPWKKMTVHAKTRHNMNANDVLCPPCKRKKPLVHSTTNCQLHFSKSHRTIHEHTCISENESTASVLGQRESERER